MSSTDCFCQRMLSSRESKPMTALSRSAATTRHKPSIKREHFAATPHLALLSISEMQ